MGTGIPSPQSEPTGAVVEAVQQAVPKAILTMAILTLAILTIALLTRAIRTMYILALAILQAGPKARYFRFQPQAS